VTLLVGVTTSDGIVLAADSRSVYTNPEGVTRVRSDLTRKVVKCERFGIGASGWASLSGRSVASHLDEFGQTAVGIATPELMCAELTNFTVTRIQAHVDAGFDPTPEEGSSVMQFIVAGYHEDIGEVWKLLLPSGERWQLNTTQSGGAIWHGDWEITDRIFMGVCPTIGDAAEKDERLKAAYEALEPAISDAELVFAPQLWTLHEALDFATVLIRTTADVQRFTNGTKGRPGKFPSVGGLIEIALIDPSGCRWVHETQLAVEHP
jgi:hypothetical protein